jgi:S1-C subfamily serine protease
VNIEPGYIITSINDKPIGSVNELIKIVREYKGAIVFNGYYENYPGEFPYTFELN